MRSLVFLFAITICSSSFAQNTRLYFGEVNERNGSFDGEQLYLQDESDLNKENTRVYISYHDNGEVSEVGNIVNNQPDGVWKKYDENGKLISKVRYSNGSKIGKWMIRDSNGKLLAKGKYDSQGNKTGEWIYWSSLEEEYFESKF